MLYTSRPPPLLHSHVWTHGSSLWFLPALQFFPRHSALSNWFQMCSPLPGTFSLPPPPPALAGEAGLLFSLWGAGISAGSHEDFPAGRWNQGNWRGQCEWSCLMGLWGLSILQEPSQLRAAPLHSSLWLSAHSLHSRGEEGQGSLLPKVIFKIHPRRALDIQRDLEESITDSCVT